MQEKQMTSEKQATQSLKTQTAPAILAVPALPQGERPFEQLVAQLTKKYPEKKWLVEVVDGGDLVTFEYEGTSIQDPFMSENCVEEVDPSMYGLAVEDARQQQMFNLYGKLATVACIARLFTYEVLRGLKEDELACARERNRSEQSSFVCHTHDFCDANLLMDAAFVKCGLVDDDGVDVIGDHLHPVWNAAWDLAKHAEFRVEALPDFTIEQKSLLLQVNGHDHEELNVDASFDAWLSLQFGALV
ncbi:hypothetical protein A9R05_41915 (plasmid) [Burkholderia sp. KK1]|uniref:Uncharacterized protein n=1 Tax=Burkholderia sp. M701 TaxID=326454 RepID=V5YPI0_9BURK|nr:hypothetical protein [Burkholderia sp. M701]AQH05583.1 hypothetical protein A9R05_41915 [Burkholderia sp. KK1]BAO18846.1 hypothetical protein [Burkholderia sp. M701]